jgi:hypothetical protein
MNTSTNEVKTTRDGFEMTPEVWQLPDDSGVIIENGVERAWRDQQWTWGYVPASGSRYMAVAKGRWTSEEEARKAMNEAICSTKP